MLTFGLVLGVGGVYAVHRRSRISHFVIALWRRNAEGGDRELLIQENEEREPREIRVSESSELREHD